MLRMSAVIASFTLLLYAGCGKQDEGKADGKSVTPGTQPSASSAQICTREGPKVAGTLKIAVVPKGSTHEFWKAIHAGAIKAELELKDVQIEWKGPAKEDDREQQINVLENFITAGVAGMAVAPLDDVALVRPIRDATKAGIAVVVMDSGLKADVCKDYVSFVATDNYVGGSHGAERLGEVLGGKGKIIMMRYHEGSASTELREQGFLDTMKSKYPNVEILSADQHGGATTESAFAKAENLLNRFKDLDGIFTPNETTTFGMLRAMQEAGLVGKVKFVGFDSSGKLIQALSEKHIQGLVVQNPMNMGYVSVKTVVAYLRGEPVPAQIDTGCVVATPENMKEPKVADMLRPPIDKYLK